MENSSIAWSLGYMLSLTNQIPADSPRTLLSMKPPAFAGTLAVFTGTALLCAAFLVYRCVSTRKERRSQRALDHALDSDSASQSSSWSPRAVQISLDGAGQGKGGVRLQEAQLKSET